MEHDASRRLAIESVDLGELSGASGVVWHVPHGGDLDANVVRLHPHEAIGAHVNGEVDVLVCVIAGGGELTVDGSTHPLVQGTVALVPVGARRGVTAGSEGITYVSAHRARTGPTINGLARR